MQCVVKPVYCGHSIETGNLALFPGRFGEEYGLLSIAWVIVASIPGRISWGKGGLVYNARACAYITPKRG